jgi:hypothetical protein
MNKRGSSERDIEYTTRYIKNMVFKKEYDMIFTLT